MCWQSIDFDYYTAANRLSSSPASLLDLFWLFANNEIYSCLHLFQFEILLLQGLLTVGPVTNEMDVYPDTKIQLHVRGGSILPMQEPARNTVHRYTGFLLYHFKYYIALSGYFSNSFIQKEPKLFACWFLHWSLQKKILGPKRDQQCFNIFILILYFNGFIFLKFLVKFLPADSS